MRQGTYISFADSADGTNTRIVTDESPLPVLALNDIHSSNVMIW